MTEDIDQLETANNKGICHKEWLKSRGHPQSCGGGHTRCPGRCRMSPPQNLWNASFFSFLGRCICSVWPHPATKGPRRASIWACSICGGRQALRPRGWGMADPAQRKGFQEPKRNNRCPPEPTSLTAWQQGNSFSQFLHFKSENALHGHSDTTPCIIKSVCIPPIPRKGKQPRVLSVPTSASGPGFLGGATVDYILWEIL